MSELFEKKNDYLINIDISANKINFNETIKSYSFYYILDSSFNFTSHQDIISNLDESEDFLIDLFLGKNQNDNFFVIGFKNTIIIIKLKKNSINKSQLKINKLKLIQFFFQKFQILKIKSNLK